MKWWYAAFDAAVIAGPLLATRLWLRDFWHHKRALVFSLAAVCVPWVLMDVAAHYLGWWQYNSQYILGWRIFGLPIEEVLFFIVVPFACLVVWHIFERQKGSVPSWLPRAFFIAFGVICLGLIAYNIGRLRTVVDAGIVLLTLAALWDSALVRRRAWWYWNGAILALFLICNTFLTAVPIVTYDTSAATGVRIGTIPVEDFLYNFSLLNLLLMVYVHAKRTQRA